jgi:hypothetical protein
MDSSESIGPSPALVAGFLRTINKLGNHMALNYITINRNKASGSQLQNVVDTMRDNTDRLRQHKEIMDNMIDTASSPINYTAIENQYGVPTGKGEALYNLVSGSTSELAQGGDATNYNQLIDWVVPLT